MIIRRFILPLLVLVLVVAFPSLALCQTPQPLPAIQPLPDSWLSLVPISLPDNPPKGWEVDIFGNPFPSRGPTNIGADQHWAVVAPVITAVAAAPGIVANPVTDKPTLSAQGKAGKSSVYLTGSCFRNIQSIQAISATNGNVVQTFRSYRQGPTNYITNPERQWVSDAVVDTTLPAGTYTFKVVNIMGTAISPIFTVVSGTRPPPPTNFKLVPQPKK